MKEQMRQMLQYADWIKGETPNEPTGKTRLKQEHIKNVVMNYEEIKAGPDGHLEFLNCIALKINLQSDSRDIEKQLLKLQLLPQSTIMSLAMKLTSRLKAKTAS